MDFAKVKNLISPLNNLAFWIFASLFLIPWVYIQQQTGINGDTAWLSLCAGRIMDGGSMLSDCFDTNPPLNILIYTPFVWISRLLNIPVYISLFWITFAFTIFSTVLTRVLLHPFKMLSKQDKDILTLAFLCTITIVPAIYFTERDHFLAAIILPFILAQITITHNYNTPATPKIFLYITLIIGSVLLLLKPHFGLVPAFLLLHRMIYQKRLWVIKDIDFIILSAITICYIAITMFFYQGFVNIVLPDIIKLYVSYNNINEAYIKSLPYVALLVLSFVSLLLLKKENKSFYGLLWICSVLCLAAYLIQAKGINYHRLPLYALLFPMIATLSYNFIKNLLPISNHKNSINIVLTFYIVAIFLAAYSFYPLRPIYPTHEEYIDNPIMEYIDKHCDQDPCSYYIAYKNMGIVNQVAFYSDNVYATRFPVYWALAGIISRGYIKDLSDDERHEIKERHVNYAVEDIERFSPSLILLYKHDEADPTDSAPYINTILDHPKIIKAMSSYKKIDNFSVDRAYFYKAGANSAPHKLNWDVYKKI